MYFRLSSWLLRCLAAKFTTARWPLMAFVFLWVPGCVILGPAKAQVQTTARAELVLGMFAYQPKPVLALKWAPLVHYLNQHSPNSPPIRLRLLTQPEMDEALERNELDFVFTNPVHYINMRTRDQLSGALATLVSSRDGYAISQLGGVVIRRSDTSGIQTLADLQGKTVGILGRRYLGGYAAQAAELLDQGISLDSIHFHDINGDHFDIVKAVVRGEVQAGFVRTGTLETMYQLGLLSPGEISVVAPRQYANFPFAVSTALYPEWAFVALANTPPEYSKKVAALLYNLSPHDPAAWQAGIVGFTIPADYAPVEQVMRRLRMAPFDTSPPFGWRDVWQKYQLMLIFSGVLLLGVFILATVLMFSYRRERKVRQESKNSQRRLEAIIEGTQAGTWEWNVQTGELHLNERWAQIVGYRLAELEPIS
ncbi:MAG: PhnD/SsuA/transferrin family substrate-binding protein, partial [Pusillimonas sp.]|nr:PhnD/SsuA/transferrin family substrate-binding protein [Pusillimonas sp.]